MNNTITQIDCKACRTHLPDLLLDDAYEASHTGVAEHLQACTECSTELNELRATFDLLSDFTAPEPSPYFDTRLHARLREAQAAQPESFWQRTRSFLLFSTGRSFQPVVASALALVLLVGGGSAYIPMMMHHSSPIASSSATVNDLKVLDNNAQAEQQMGQLLDQSGSEDGDTLPTS